MKNQFKFKNLPSTVNSADCVPKSHEDGIINDPSIMRNISHVDFNNKNVDNPKFVKVTSYPAVGGHLTSKYYLDEALFKSVDESSLSRLDPNEVLKLDEQDSIFLNSTSTSPKMMIEIPN